MHKALYPRDDVDRLYVSRKKGGRGLTSIEDSVDASIQRLEDYIEKHERRLITTIRNDTDNTIDDRMTTTRKQKWEEKTTLWPLWTSNKQHLTPENPEQAKKKKPLERNGIPPNSSTGQRHKNQ